MDTEKQRPASVAANMPEAMAKGATCIDCHKGIAHHMPKFPDDDDDEAEKAKSSK